MKAKTIIKDFDSYDDMNAFCMKCRSYPRGMCECDTHCDLYLNGKYSGFVYLRYDANQAFVHIGG